MPTGSSTPPTYKLATMNTFHFEVDEEYAKQHNELLRDTKSMVLSGIAIFILCVLGGSHPGFSSAPPRPGASSHLWASFSSG